MSTYAPDEIALLREGGGVLANIVHTLADMIAPGVSTLSLENEARRLAASSGGEPAFLGYRPAGAPRPYPAALCLSVNDEAVHGIPNEDPRTLVEGDLVTLDMGLRYKGLITDMAITVPVGEVSDEAENLMRATREALTAGIGAAKAGNTVGDIGAAIEAVVAQSGFSVMRELGGHGVGRSVHEEPFIPNIGVAGRGPVLEAGQVVALEPIVSAGSGRAILADDGYTYREQDGSLTAQFEHTIVVTHTGGDVITKT